MKGRTEFLLIHGQEVDHLKKGIDLDIAELLEHKCQSNILSGPALVELATKDN